MRYWTGDSIKLTGVDCPILRKTFFSKFTWDRGGGQYEGGRNGFHFTTVLYTSSPMDTCALENKCCPTQNKRPHCPVVPMFNTWTPQAILDIHTFLVRPFHTIHHSKNPRWEIFLLTCLFSRRRIFWLPQSELLLPWTTGLFRLSVSYLFACMHTSPIR